MRITITGKTEATISFTTLGIVLRGKTSAKSIEIKNDDQLREVVGVKNAGLVDVIREDVPEQPEQPEKPEKPAKSSVPTNVPKFIPPKNIEKEVEEKEVEEKEEKVEKVEEVEAVEDAPTKEDVPAKKGRGRPKGSPNKTKKTKKNIEPPKIVKETPKEAPKQAKPIKPIKPIKKIEASKAPKETNAPKDDEDQIVVMVDGKAIRGSARNSFSPEIPDDERTRASIEALKQMEAEEEGEKAEAKEFDESSLPIQDRMGNPATISVGKNKNEKVPMKNSFVPEAKQIKDAEKFIPLVDEETQKKINKKAKDAFIDLDDDEKDPKDEKNAAGDSFIEI